MRKLTTDFHIHTEFSCDSACIKYEDLISELSKNGITDFGITDHLHWLVQEEDIKRSKQAFDKALLNCPELNGRMHFGIETSIMSEWELDLLNRGVYPKGHIYGIHRLCPTPNPKPAIAIDEEFKQKHGIEYVVSGVHWQLYPNHDKQSVINEYFRLYMFAVANPLTDILAHFLWWNKWEKDVDSNPFIDMEVITPSMRSELECALKENDVAFEVNIANVCTKYGEVTDSFADQYLSYVKELQDKGIKLSFATDLHADKVLDRYDCAEKLFEKYKIDPEKFWKL